MEYKLEFYTEIFLKDFIFIILLIVIMVFLGDVIRNRNMTVRMLIYRFVFSIWFAMTDHNKC